VLALVMPSLSCKSFLRTVTPHPPPEPPPSAALDVPPPSHTGGLGVLTVGPSGQQGSGGSPGSHGNPVASGIATGVGALVVGATVTKTVAACAQPDASLACLRGPGPADSVSDAGTP
jgi:hypothetical protein